MHASWRSLSWCLQLSRTSIYHCRQIPCFLVSCLDDACRYPAASCASSIQHFDPGLTDLIKEVDSLVSTPARRPTHSDWNWLDQQLGSRRGARSHVGAAAADALSEVTYSSAHTTHTHTHTSPSPGPSSRLPDNSGVPFAANAIMG